MRIVLIGQAAFGEKVLQKLIDKGEQIVGVYTIPDVPGRANPLKDMALKLNIPVFQPKDMRTPEVFSEYTKLNPELNVMAFVTVIIPESILFYPKLGTIQYHPSLLPKHRGGSAINWAIINGETKTGISIFWPDKGLDTGPILLQKEVEISPDDTVGTLYFNKLFPLEVEAIAESIDLIREGKAPKIKQDESQATYEPLVNEKMATINWNQPANKVYNFIRGTNPSPGATTTFKGEKLKIFDAQLLPGDTQAMPGEIIEVTGQGFKVAAAYGAVLVKRVQPAGSPKIEALEFARQVLLKKGDKLGN